MLARTLSDKTATPPFRQRGAAKTITQHRDSISRPRLKRTDRASSIPAGESDPTPLPLISDARDDLELFWQVRSTV
jgi:hypothetical protein